MNNESINQWFNQSIVGDGFLVKGTILVLYVVLLKLVRENDWILLFYFMMEGAHDLHDRVVRDRRDASKCG